jgi:DNA-binding MarR family transcriptional regulator
MSDMKPSEFDIGKLLPYRLRRITSRLALSAEAMFQEVAGISIYEWRVISLLAQGENTAAAIAPVVMLDKVQTGRCVARLYSLGYLLQRADASDGRKTLLRLSAKGKQAFLKTAEISLAIERHLRDGLSTSEQRELDRLVDKLDQISQSLPTKHSLLQR